MHNRHTAAVRAYHIREGPSSSFRTMLGTSTSTRYAGTCMLYASMLCAQIFPPLQYLHQQYIRSTECKDCRLQYHTSLYGVLDQMHCRLRVRICPQPDHESSRYHDAFPCSTIYPGSFYPTGTVRRSLLASGTESRVLSP